jgi:organic hydroperoxide reductase OsmC/OhrA
VSQHSAIVNWQAAPGGFKKRRFSRVHQWQFDGGLEVPASASPAVIGKPWSDPAAVDPEEAFVAAIASCHMMSFLYLASELEWEVVSYADHAEGTLAANLQGRQAITAVLLNPAIEFAAGKTPPAAEISTLHEQAHELCFIANSVSTKITIKSTT